MKNKIVVLGILLLAMGIFSWGCYTILTHPTVAEEEGKATSHQGEYYREHCTDCHAEYHNYPYGFYYNYYPDYYWNSPRWGYYYIYPWWWDRYWWDNEPSPESAPEKVDKVERRRGLEPPYVPLTTDYNRPLSKPEDNPPVKVKTEDTQNKKQEQEKKSEDKSEKRRK